MTKFVLYDIASPKQPRSYAPNPSKARLALGFKDVSFRTEWVDILDIEKVRKSLNCPATRKLDDGTDFFTLPMLHDTQSGTVLGDSFDIADYLDANFPDSGPPLFPTDITGPWQTYESPAKDTPFFAPITTNADARHSAFARFNLHVDATFSANMILYGQFLPFNPETADDVKALMCRRAHLASWDDICITGEARAALFAGFKEALKGVADLFGASAREEHGMWLEGERPCYADLIVGGWLNMLSSIMPEAEWLELRGWYGGVFARVHDALQERYFVC